MKTKQEIINSLIAEHGYNSYLEIGYGSGASFKAIEAAIKVSVDPEADGATFKMTSDAYFKANNEVFDIVFIDGLHHADQVRKDIINASKCLSKDGAIVIHDTIPLTKEMQAVPRVAKQWTGDVYKAVVGLIEKYPDVNVYTHDTDFGVTVVFPHGKKFAGKFEKDMEWESFKPEMLNLKNE